VRKLTRGSAPPELTLDLMKDLTDRFKADNKQRVWDIAFLKNALLAFSHNKCAYCETLISEESKYMEVEHFHCKSVYENLVVDWNNLLPACKRCNVSKGNHDVLNGGMIVDPTQVEPSDHLFLRNYRYVERTPVGEWTIFALSLNDIKRSSYPRFLVGQKIEEALEGARETVVSWGQSGPSDRSLRRVLKTIAGLLSETEPDAAYSATAATALIESDHYRQIREELVRLQAWTPDLESLHNEAMRAALIGP
jgi:hypothetical protein